VRIEDFTGLERRGGPRRPRDGIRVNCVCLGTPWEVAEAALYLAEDSAGFVTGSILTIDGGITAQ
jgi:NAD(P)-dependent dehydrogenase (short-subunit alcohol dehydrogenase family)